MGLSAPQVLSLTPREYAIEMGAQVERTYDELERRALIAIMHEKAHRAKKPKSSDLFKRPVDDVTAKNRTEDLLEKAEQASAWLSQFEQFNNAGKEDANG